MNCHVEPGEMQGPGFRMHMMRGCCEGEENLAGLERMAEACGCGGGFARRYKTKEEKVAGLEAYLKELETEAAAVREAIADLKPA
jgi:hypothetical protein